MSQQVAGSGSRLLFQYQAITWTQAAYCQLHPYRKKLERNLNQNKIQFYIINIELQE